MGPESLAILELFIELAKSWGCEAVLAWIFLKFLKLFFILVANVETEVLQGAWASCWLLAYFAPSRMFLPWLSSVLQLLKDLEGVWIKTSAL